MEMGELWVIGDNIIEIILKLTGCVFPKFDVEVSRFLKINR